MTKERARISLCMIVKNERDWIRQCLESVRPIVSESIVVDTGSSDDTVAIAEECGATVLQFPWSGDFAAARNFSLSRASGDWILVLDADEMIAPSNLEELVGLTSDRSHCYQFAQRHYTEDHRISNFTALRGEFPEIERGQGGYFESRCVRLFPNHCGLHFQGKVHELVEHSIKLNPELSILPSEIRIHHFGHTAAVRARKDKSPLYHSLGKEKTIDAPQDWKNFYELGIECNCSGRLHESAQAFLRSIELNPSYVPTWTNLGYVFCELGQFEAAVYALTHAIKLDPRCPEAYCNLGVVQMRLGAYAKAERIFLHALALSPNYVNARCNLGETLAQLGRLSEAALHYRYALQIAPTCASALADLGALYLHAGALDEAERLLRNAAELPLVRERAMHNLHTLLVMTQRVDEAVAMIASMADATSTVTNTAVAQEATPLTANLESSASATASQV
ncbi:MAG: tetratricopeptide repeat protein [Proteobacteria bacterium]|nr:tetratricopeptide repeat protein [Pseudomonadota bacterium]